MTWITQTSCVGWHWNLLDNPVLMARLKLLMTEIDIHHRLETSCELEGTLHWPHCVICGFFIQRHHLFLKSKQNRIEFVTKPGASGGAVFLPRSPDILGLILKLFMTNYRLLLNLFSLSPIYKLTPSRSVWHLKMKMDNCFQDLILSSHEGCQKIQADAKSGK